MAKKFHKPVRMCVACRQKDTQDKLLRLQCENGLLREYGGIGRSFYICNSCLSCDGKAIKAIMRQCKSKERDKFTSRLKEIITDDRKS